MIQTYIKYIFILLSSFYFYCKLLHLAIKKSTILKVLCISLLLPILLYKIGEYSGVLLTWGLGILFFILATKLTKTTYSVSLITSIVAYGFSYFTFLLAAIITFPFGILLIYWGLSEPVYLFITQLLIGILQFIISTIPFRFKRLKNGMPFLSQVNSASIGVIISLLILLLISFQHLYAKLDILFIFSLLFISLCGALLFRWWRRQLTITYIQKIHIREIENLQEKIETLQRDNENLSKIIHKDNKLIPAMEMAVRTFLSTTAEQDRDAVGQQLLKELEALTTERTGILTSYEATNVLLPSTGLIRIDSVLGYMLRKATFFQIHLNFIKNADLKHMTETILNEEDLATIIADLTENAIIASKEQKTKNILLVIGIENGHYCLNIFDSGIPFKAQTILNLGQIRSTTHADTGGSGIGMMQTFEFLHKYQASFTIDETIANSLYTKKLTLCFDKRHEIHIRSEREEIKVLRSHRPDFIFE